MFLRESWDRRRVDFEVVLGGDHRELGGVGDACAERLGEPCEVPLEATRVITSSRRAGTWLTGTDGDTHSLDAVEFCRILAGRASGEGLLANPVTVLTSWAPLPDPD